MENKGKDLKTQALKNAWNILRNDSSLTWPECLKKGWNAAKNGVIIEKIEVKPIEIKPEVKPIETINFDQIFKENYKFVYYSIKNHNSNLRNDEIEDLTIETFEKLHSQLNVFSPEKGTIHSFLKRMAINLTIDYHRKSTNFRNGNNGNIVNISSYVNDEGEEYLQLVDNDNYEVEIVQSKDNFTLALNNISDKHKNLLLLLAEGRKYKEIAEILDMPLNSVCVTIKRAKESLSKQLKTLGIEYDLTLLG